MDFSLKDIAEFGSTIVVVAMFLWYLNKRDAAAVARETMIVGALNVLGQHLDSMRDHCADTWNAMLKHCDNGDPK